MRPFKRGQKVKYDGIVPWLTGKFGTVSGWTRDGWITVQFDHGIERCAECHLQKVEDKK